MARIDTLSNFLTDVSSAIKQKTGGSSPIPASSFDTEILSITTGGTYQTKSQSIATNGNYIITPDTGYDAIEQLNLSVAVNPILQNKTITQNGVYTADSGYEGFDTVTVSVQGGGNIHMFSTLSDANDSNPQSGDIALIQGEIELTELTTSTPFSHIVLKTNIVFTEAITSNKYIYFTNASEESFQITIGSTSIRVNSTYQGNSVTINYTSSDGIIYTTDSSDVDLVIGRKLIQNESYISYFMQMCEHIYQNKFTGVYQAFYQTDTTAIRPPSSWEIVEHPTYEGEYMVSGLSWLSAKSLPNFTPILENIATELQLPFDYGIRGTYFVDNNVEYLDIIYQRYEGEDWVDIRSAEFYQYPTGYKLSTWGELSRLKWYRCTVNTNTSTLLSITELTPTQNPDETSMLEYVYSNTATYPIMIDLYDDNYYVNASYLTVIEDDNTYWADPQGLNIYPIGTRYSTIMPNQFIATTSSIFSGNNAYSNNGIVFGRAVNPNTTTLESESQLAENVSAINRYGNVITGDGSIYNNVNIISAIDGMAVGGAKAERIITRLSETNTYYNQYVGIKPTDNKNYIIVEDTDYYAINDKYALTYSNSTATSCDIDIIDEKDLSDIDIETINFVGTKAHTGKINSDGPFDYISLQSKDSVAWICPQYDSNEQWCFDVVGMASNNTHKHLTIRLTDKILLGNYTNCIPRGFMKGYNIYLMFASRVNNSGYVRYKILKITDFSTYDIIYTSSYDVRADNNTSFGDVGYKPEVLSNGMALMTMYIYHSSGNKCISIAVNTNTDACNDSWTYDSSASRTPSIGMIYGLFSLKDCYATGVHNLTVLHINDITSSNINYTRHVLQSPFSDTNQQWSGIIEFDWDNKRMVAEQIYYRAPGSSTTDNTKSGIRTVTWSSTSTSGVIPVTVVSNEGVPRIYNHSNNYTQSDFFLGYGINRNNQTVYITHRGYDYEHSDPSNLLIYNQNRHYLIGRYFENHFALN